VLVLSKFDHSIVALLVKGLVDAVSDEPHRHSNEPCEEESNGLVDMLSLVSDIFTVPQEEWGVIEIGILANYVGERVMPDDMLVVPHVWRVEHEADIDSNLVNQPVH
jgi:hypothetical protein